MTSSFASSLKRFSRTRLLARLVIATLCASLFPAAVAQAQAPNVDKLLGPPQSRICIIGNTLAERMQHHAWLETALQARFPEREISVRNLGFSGDELTLRLRSAGFGSPDDHLRLSQADVIWMMFGFNESFAGEAGLEKFEQDLRNEIQHLSGQTYAEAPPLIVLFTPIAVETLPDTSLPGADSLNAQIAPYAATIQRVAVDLSLPCVDLFSVTSARVAGAPALTFNGIHLSEQGDRELAIRLEERWFGDSILRDESASDRVAAIRSAILDRNFHWYNRYRTVDGYSIFGGRADLRFVNGQSNREVMDREMEILDVLTANRDRHIWSVAQGKNQPIDDSNVPPFLEVISNKQGPLPGGKHEFLGATEAMELMTVGSGLRVELFASEEDFPELANPVQMAFDTRGRLWVAVMPSYPHWKPMEKMDDKLLILEDTDHDGRADKCTTFAGGLHVPTGLEFWGGGVLVGQQPDLMFLKDTDGDDVADVRERVIHGVDSADTHHALNSFALGPGGDLYFQEGTFHHTQVETSRGPVRSANAAVYRYEPYNQRFNVHVAYGFANPHGHVFDRWGQQFMTDGTGAVNYFATAFSGHLDFPQKHAGMRPFFQQRTRPCPATEILSSSHFPADWQGNYLIANVIGVQGILRYHMLDDGSGFSAQEAEPLILSSDPNFRPVDLEVGPDGAIWFCDWQNPLIGHMQHNLRDPNRDREHGRIYRIVRDGAALSPEVAIADESTDRLVQLLAHGEYRVRYRTKIELSARPSAEVIEAVDRWTAGLTSTGEDLEHDLLEALWVKQYHNAVDQALLDRVSRSPDARARAAAIRVTWAWRDRLDDALARLIQAAQDEHPRVRLEAVRAASYLDEPEAIEVVILARQRDMDYYLEYCANETMRALDPIWKQAIADGREIKVGSAEARAFILGNLPLESLLEQPRTLEVYRELLIRSGVQDDVRLEAANALAIEAGVAPGVVLLATLEQLDQSSQTQDSALLFDLVRLLASRPTEELAGLRDRIERLALAGRQGVIRQMAFVAMIQVDGNTQAVWDLASREVGSLRDLVTALPAIADPQFRAELYPRVAPLLDGLPEPLASQVGPAKGSYGRYVRIELPRRGTLTLAEVEVHADGQNVARTGRATQLNTAHGGDASRAIDGNRSGTYGDGGQTHTAENTDAPWWEVDLGEEYPVDSIIIFNRTDGDLGNRLAGFTVKVLDGGRQEVFSAVDQPAPQESVEFRLESGGPAGMIRRAAMLAMTSVRGREVETFNRLTQFFVADEDSLQAARAMLRIPRREWPQDQAAVLVPVLLERLATIPVDQRTSPAALDLMQLTEAAAELLPADQAREARKALRDIGVRMLRLSTVPHRMAYDQELLVVQAGKPVELVFENTDIMPHNLVLVRPGSMETVGLRAEEEATAVDAVARHYVPNLNQVLASSRLLQPRERQTLSFNAPTEPGVYPYVCTYPGHWRRMYGALYVVEDLDAYLEDPTAYLAAKPMEILDPLLADNRPRTTWTLADLLDDLPQVEEERSFVHGRDLFTVTGCAACHQLGGVGVVFGPDLKARDPNWKTADVLKEILEPSARIHEKFRSEVLELESGETLSGLVLEENDQRLLLITNPLASDKPLEILKEEILNREVSPVSLMPEGLLDKLTRNEILDLLAYVMANGEADDARFSDGHDHHGAGGQQEHHQH
ncbi:MAG: discoidin domain-containing protein [Planctomycetales bacterium]|nr:discoidin domain-containing protein [Planctomycetales bacterium]